MTTAYFNRRGSHFEPTNLARGFWADNTLTGPATASLLAFCLERDFGAQGWVAARFAVDLLSLIQATTISVETFLVRDGQRLRLAEATIRQHDILVARATCQFLRETEGPVNPVWQTPGWGAQAPTTGCDEQVVGAWTIVALPEHHGRIARERVPVSSARKDDTPVLRTLANVLSRQAWFRSERTVVNGVALTPFLRAAIIGDWVSPMANSSEASIDFINTDFTMYLYRQPAGEWIGMELMGHRSAAGIAIAECWLHDADGPLGSVNASAISQSRRRS